MAATIFQQLHGDMQVSALDMIRHAKSTIATTTVINSYTLKRNQCAGVVSGNTDVPDVTRFPAMS